MVITASGGLYMARANLKLALKEPQETEAYKRYVESLRRNVDYWKRQIKRQKKTPD